MNSIDKNSLIKAFLALLAIFLFVGTASFLHKKNSVTLDEYAKQHPEQASQASLASLESSDLPEKDDPLGSSPAAPVPEEAPASPSLLTGALLNGGADGKAMLSDRVTYTSASGATSEDSDFYYEPLSENLQRYITGVSYPPAKDDTGAEIAVRYSDLRYVHILHYNFEGVPTEGELICNLAIAQDLLEIFHELYRNEYQIEKVRLIDEYDADDDASMADNNTSCFNYRMVDGTNKLSRHALGMALDVNPFYNPYVAYGRAGGTQIFPPGSEAYADRNVNFPYKIDEDDLCYKLFIRHGFTWGGNWNSEKDYQHFQKVVN